MASNENPGKKARKPPTHDNHEIITFGEEKIPAHDFKKAVSETTLEVLKGITQVARRAQRGTLTFEDASYLKAVSDYMKPVFNAAVPLIAKQFGLAVAKKMKDRRNGKNEIFEDPLAALPPARPVPEIINAEIVPASSPQKKKAEKIDVIE